jgi:hypothetical protein
MRARRRFLGVAVLSFSVWSDQDKSINSGRTTGPGPYAVVPIDDCGDPSKYETAQQADEAAQPFAPPSHNHSGKEN